MVAPLLTLPVLLTNSKPSWICTIVWTSVLILIGLNTVSGELCTTADMMSLQTPCKKQNNDLVSFVGTNKSTQLCSAFKEVLFCVAVNKPKCIHNVTLLYQHLTHSPHNCILDTDTILKIQNIINETSKRGSTTTEMATVKVETGKEGGGYAVTSGHAGRTANTGTSIRGPPAILCSFVVYFLLYPRLPVL